MPSCSREPSTTPEIDYNALVHAATALYGNARIVNHPTAGLIVVVSHDDWASLGDVLDGMSETHRAQKRTRERQKRRDRPDGPRQTQETGES